MPQPNMNTLLKAPSLSHTDMVARNNSSPIGAHDASAMASRYGVLRSLFHQCRRAQKLFLRGKRGSGGGERTRRFSMIKHSIGGPFPTRRGKVASEQDQISI